MYLFLQQDETAAQKREDLSPDDVEAVANRTLEIYRFNLVRHRFERLTIEQDDSGITRIWEIV